MSRLAKRLNLFFKIEIESSTIHSRREVFLYGIRFRIFVDVLFVYEFKCPIFLDLAINESILIKSQQKSYNGNAS